jgi:hypothetical protein
MPEGCAERACTGVKEQGWQTIQHDPLAVASAAKLELSPLDTSRRSAITLSP